MTVSELVARAPRYAIVKAKLERRVRNAESMGQGYAALRACFEIIRGKHERAVEFRQRSGTVVATHVKRASGHPGYRIAGINRQ